MAKKKSTSTQPESPLTDDAQVLADDASANASDAASPAEAEESPAPADLPQEVTVEVINPTVTVTAGPDSANDVADLDMSVFGASADPAFTGTMPKLEVPAAAPATIIPAPPAYDPAAFAPAAVEPLFDAVTDEHAPGLATIPAPEVAPASSTRRQREDGPEPAAALTSDRLLAKAAAPPMEGWRRWLYRVTFGAVNVGDSDKTRLARAQDHLIATRLGDHTRYVPVLSRKGGVGKTTVTTLLGMVLADTREDRVIALDANPDRGTLSDRSPGRADFTARQLVRDRFNVTTFSQLSEYVARDGSRLDILASDTDPAVAQAFDDADYRAVTDILSKFYSVVLTDSGTGMVHSVMKGTLEKADAVVLVSGGSVDEARLASETLSWLEAHGRTDLVENATVVINMSGGETQVDIDQIENHFRSRVRNVLRIPYDKHLAEGSRVELDKLRPATRAAAKELGALVVTELLKS